MTTDNKDQKDKAQEESKDKKPEFKAKRYPRPWEMELTDEQRENLRKSIAEDEKRFKELGKRMAEDKSTQEMFEKLKK